MESRYSKKVCAGCAQEGKCGRCPDWHEDTERFDCSEYTEAEDDEGNYGHGFPQQAE